MDNRNLPMPEPTREAGTLAFPCSVLLPFPFYARLTSTPMIPKAVSSMLPARDRLDAAGASEWPQLQCGDSGL